MTKERLLHVAAQLDQLYRELESISRPVSHGGAPDISLSASHMLGTVQSFIQLSSTRLTRLAGTL